MRIVLVIVPLHLTMCAGVYVCFNVLITAFNTTDELKWQHGKKLYFFYIKIILN